LGVQSQGPASTRSGFERVDVYLICRKGDLVFRPTVPVSGAPAPGPVIPPIATVSLSLKVPGSQNMFSLSREVTCAVKRRVGFSVPGALPLLAGRLKSGSYSHLVRSPAFLL